MIVDPARVDLVLEGQARLRDRDEAEVRGYRDALRLIHGGAASLSITEATIRELHRLARAGAGDAGAYREKDLDIVERYPDGRTRIRFRTVAPGDLSRAMADLTSDWDACVTGR